MNALHAGGSRDRRTVAPSIMTLERLARARVTRNTFDYIRSGARHETTLAANVAAWSNWDLIPRALVDVSHVDIQTEALGHRLALPVMVAPMGAQRVIHPDGEIAVARASAGAGTVMIVSTGSTAPFEELAAVDNLQWWFQLYALADTGISDALVKRAADFGASAIVLTVDSQASRSTHRRPRGGVRYPVGVVDALWPAASGGPPLDLALTWDVVARLRDIAHLPIVLKGILHPDDAERAVEYGVTGIVVSNHGGRSLDGAAPTATALPEIAKVVNGRLDVYVDGGIRRGIDILRALALGARAVLVGRPFLWGLAYDGERGVALVFDTLREELLVDASLLGIPRIAEIPASSVRWACVCHSANRTNRSS